MYRETWFSKKMFTSELNVGFEKSVHRGEIHRLSSKEKIPGAAFSKDGDADSLLRHEGYITVYFLDLFS